jgi:4-amino-4-deoxy-L-arabinose transferase-like glycosyltransferase
MKSWLPGTDSSRFGWADLVVVPLIAVLSLPPLLWFGLHWTVSGNDSARYLLAGSQLIAGDALEDIGVISEYNGGHGPGLPVLVGSLILLFGRDTEALVWALRLISLLNPLLAYLLVKRISTPLAGLIAAALVGLLAFNIRSPVAINIDALGLTFYLLSLLALLGAIKREGILLAPLSGVLLGVAVLTKETAIVNLPLALLAVLLLDWDLRGAIWHYLGVALACLPWWTLVYLATGEMYLVGQLPAGLRVSILAAAVVFLVVAVVAYVSGMVDRFLASERRRRWSGLSVAIVWTILLLVMLLATASYALGEITSETLRLYLADLLEPAVVVVPVLLAVVGYSAWKAFRENGPWRLLALALLFQVPVCLLLTVQRWAVRQFLVPQTLVFCVLAALVVAAFSLVWRGRGGAYRMAVAVGAALLAVMLLASSVQTVRALLPKDLDSGFAKQKQEFPAAQGMVDWMDENVPAGERILVVSEPAINVPEANYLRYLDGGRHGWTTLRLDQGICVPRPNVQIGCDPDQNAISRIPPEALWVQWMGGKCSVVSLSGPNLLEQSRRSGADYVAIYGGRRFPAILELSPALRASGAFDLAHANVFVRRKTDEMQGVALLKSTGETADAAPTWMNANTAFMLKRCERAMGSGYEKRLRSKFPNGVTGVRGAFEPFEETPTQ